MANYYDELYEMLDGLFNEQLDEFETDEKVLDHLNEYLKREKDLAELGWLELHYVSAAEHLLDNMCDYEEHGEELIRCANREIEIFREHGQNKVADRIQDQIEKIREMVASREIYVIEKNTGDVLETVTYDPKKFVTYTIALEKAIDFNVKNNYKSVGLEKKYNIFADNDDIETIYVEKITNE